MTVAFLETTGDRHLLKVGGLPAVERRVRELARQKVERVIIAADPVNTIRPLPIPVEFVPPGSTPPADARRERADVIADIELVDEAAAKAAEWKLIRTMNKSHEGPVDALINWRFSMRITRALSRRSLAITPNHVTMIAIVIGICASAVASLGSYAMLALGGVLLQVQSILDSVDGELARLRFQFSKLGQYLDNMSDDIVDNAFIVAVGYALGGTWWWLAVGAAAGRLIHAAVTYVWVIVKTGTLDVFAFRWWFESASASADEVYSPHSITTWLRSLGRRDTYVFIWMVACVCGFPYWVIGHALVISAINLALIVLHFGVFRGRLT